MIGFVSSRGVGKIELFEENMTASIMKKLLTNNLVSSAEMLFGKQHRNWWHLHDNDKKYKSKVVKKWCFDNGIQNIDFPAYSPDLNPIENVWSVLKRQVESRNPQSIDDLKIKIAEEWHNIDNTYVAKLINSMKTRCQSVIANDGGRTKY